MGFRREAVGTLRWTMAFGGGGLLARPVRADAADSDRRRTR